VNTFMQSHPINDTQISPNHNNWTLLRTITELQPQLVECLPSNSCVLLGWQPFLNDNSLQYNVFRRPLSGVPEWQRLNQEPLSGLSYTDTTVENGFTYQYVVSAVTADGWESKYSNLLSATPLAFSFAYPLLVVDETRDGTGANINPNDAMVDDFYAAALTPLEFDEWDCAAQGMPGLDVLGQYQVVLWHADDFAQNLLVDHLNTLGGYLLGGGKVLLSGWKTASILSESFLDRFAGDIGLVYDNSASLISAESDIYPTLIVDPLKLTASWNGMLPQIYTFTGVQNSLYTANMNPGSQGNGNCAAFRYINPTANGIFVMLGFPLYFMQAEGVRGFLQQIIPELLSGVANPDGLPAPSPIRLVVYPNPFNPSTTISFSLPHNSEVELSIYNLKGQKVRQLFTESKAAGNHELIFDGKDSWGNPLSSGIYILRMSCAGEVLSRRISLLK